jgi:hypothetical protein
MLRTVLVYGAISRHGHVQSTRRGSRCNPSGTSPVLHEEKVQRRPRTGVRWRFASGSWPTSRITALRWVFMVTSLASLGLADRARDWTRRALLFDPDNARLHYNLACAMATLEDADMAVALIEPLIDKVGPGALRWFQSDNSLDPIRKHPRFIALSEQISRQLAAKTPAEGAA